MKERLFELLENNYDEMVTIRRHLHMHPEVSFQEFKTANYIVEYYKKLGVDVQSGVGGNGVVAKIKGAKPGKTIALRADFDALPIQEETGLPYASKNPCVMHACGHDGHTATLLAIGYVLNQLKDQLSGEYVLIHQHAEEISPGGALGMIEAGCLDGVDMIFATHLWANLPYGTVTYKHGPMMAAADRFEITIKGFGGHGAQPHTTKDATVIGAQLILNLQQIVIRRTNPIEPAVVTIGSFHSGDAFNVIADSATISGTVRTFDDTVKQTIKDELTRIIEGTCHAANCEFDFEYIDGFPAVINHHSETDFLIDCAKEVDAIDQIAETELQMGGEDFARYLQSVKGAFFFTGAAPDQVDTPYPHHHPKFDINEKAMLLAAKTLGLTAIKAAQL